MKQSLGRRSRRFLFLAVLIFALAAGVAYATVPDSGGVYAACMLKADGSIRLIDPSLGQKNKLGHCKATETRVTWNKVGQPGTPGQPGQKGDIGPSGPSGPQGPAGVSGYAAQSISGTIPVGQGVEGTATCASGKNAVGGGWDAGQFVTPPNTSHPKADGTAWIGELNNNTGASLPVTFYVVCVGVSGTSSASLQRGQARPARAKLTLTRR